MQTYTRKSVDFTDPDDGKEFEDFGDGFMVALELDRKGELEVFDMDGDGCSFTLNKKDVERLMSRFQEEVIN